MVPNPVPSEVPLMDQSYATRGSSKLENLIHGDGNVDNTSRRNTTNNTSNSQTSMKEERNAALGSSPVDHDWQISPGVIHAFSGASAGFASGVVTCPLDVIKTKLQAQGGFSPIRQVLGGRVAGASNFHTAQPGAYKGLGGTAKTIWREDGFKGFYRGLGPITLGYLPTWAVYFTVYERCKQLYVLEDPNKKWVTHILSAMTAGACSTLCTNPIWVIKTRLMSQNNSTSAHRTPWHYTSTLDAARKMFRQEGIGSFYSGLAPALLGLTHVAVQFPLYEYFKQLFIGPENPRVDHELHHMMGVLGASIVSKVCASSATYPHEVIRTRMQIQRRVDQTTEDGSKSTKPYERKYKGVIHAVKTVYREEGWRAFYAGMGTNMVRAVPASAMTLLTYEIMVKELSVFAAEGKV